MHYILASLIFLANSFSLVYAGSNIDEELSKNYGYSSPAGETLVERIYGDSFNTQVRDLKLIDNADLLGDIWFQEQSREKIKRPFLYRISKNDRVGYVLGSCHNAPLSFFSEEMIDIMKSCRNYIGESAADTPLSRMDLENAGLLINIEKEDENWFDELDDPIKNYLTYIFKECSQKLSKEVDIGEMTLGFAKLVYEMCTQQRYCMDDEIKSLFPTANVHSLEKFENMIVHIPCVTPPPLLKEWQDALYYDLTTGQGINNQYIKDFILDYKQGSLFLKADIFLENSFVTPRNFNWMDIWHHYFETLDNPLYCVGAAHLFGEYGILNLLFQAGYSIEYPFNAPYPTCDILS